MRSIAVVCMLVVAVSVASAGDQHRPGRDDKEAQHHGSLWKELGLTEAQRESLKSLRAEQMVELRDIGKKLREVRKTVKVELLKSDPSNSVLDRAAGDAGDLTEDLTASFIDHMLEVKKVLTPEQFSMLLERGDMLKLGGMSYDRARARNGGKSAPKKGKEECPHATPTGGTPDVPDTPAE